MVVLRGVKDTWNDTLLVCIISRLSEPVRPILYAKLVGCYLIYYNSAVTGCC